MPHILDNMIWNALATGNREMAIADGDTRCYDPGIAPFASVKEWDDESWEKLHAFIPAGRWTVIAYPDDRKPGERQWKILNGMLCCQMVYEYPVTDFITAASSQIVPLTMEHVPQMLELTALTKPGPFLEKTILFGNYFGIFVDGRLAAMAGQRMHPVPYLEVSAVCTHPDFRGKGFAKTLMLHVMKLILDNSFIPFLHVLASNTNAIQLYESIGFRTRKQLMITALRRL